MTLLPNKDENFTNQVPKKSILLCLERPVG